MFPAEFTVSSKTKKREAVAHAGLLENIQLYQGNTATLYYTDGSQRDTTAAAAVCRIGEHGGFDLAKSWNLGSGVEVADAEVFAVQKALTLACQDCSSNIRSIYIFVDSQAAIARLQSCRGNADVQQAAAAAEELKNRGIKLCIQWCPSHMGISGNDMADALAKSGLELSPAKNGTASVSLGHLKRLVKIQTTAMWQSLWQAQQEKEEEGGRGTGMGRLYRLIARDCLAFSLRPRTMITSMPRRIISAYIQLKTGKGLLKSYQYTIGKASDDRCFCAAGKRQDTQHLLLECKKYTAARARLKKQLSGVPLQLNVLFCTDKGHKALVKFLEETGICTMGWQRSMDED